MAVSLAVAGLAIWLGGCGGAADPQVATAGGAGAAPTSTGAAPVVDEEEQRWQFGRCMREHGVDMPDPEPGGGPVRIQGGGGGADEETVRAAMDACRSLLPNGGKPPQLSPEDVEKARAMAQCMREHGVDMPDPDPNGSGGVRLRRQEGAAAPDREKLDAAFQACRHLRPQRQGGGG